MAQLMWIESASSAHAQYTARWADGVRGVYATSRVDGAAQSRPGASSSVEAMVALSAHL